MSEPSSTAKAMDLFLRKVLPRAGWGNFSADKNGNCTYFRARKLYHDGEVHWRLVLSLVVVSSQEQKTEFLGGFTLFTEECERTQCLQGGFRGEILPPEEFLQHFGKTVYHGPDTSKVWEFPCARSLEALLDAYDRHAMRVGASEIFQPFLPGKALL
jgi:hypothetical protein